MCYPWLVIQHLPYEYICISNLSQAFRSEISIQQETIDCLCHSLQAKLIQEYPRYPLVN